MQKSAVMNESTGLPDTVGVYNVRIAGNKSVSKWTKHNKVSLKQNTLGNAAQMK